MFPTGRSVAVRGAGRGAGARRRIGIAALVAATVVQGAVQAEPVDIDWRKVATSNDRARIRNWRHAWLDAIAKARTSASGASVLDADRALFEPDGLLQGSMPPEGRYRCRMHRLGGVGAATHPLTSGRWLGCAVGHEGRTATFAMDGQQRISGHLFDAADARTIFLGTLTLAGEVRVMRYGRDARRDMAGVVERIGERRWRLALPYPGFQSTLDVIEVEPA